MGDGWRALSARLARETLASYTTRALAPPGYRRGGFALPRREPNRARERERDNFLPLPRSERIYAGTRQLETSVVTRHALTSQDRLWPRST